MVRGSRIVASAALLLSTSTFFCRKHHGCCGPHDDFDLSPLFYMFQTCVRFVGFLCCAKSEHNSVILASMMDMEYCASIVF